MTVVSDTHLSPAAREAERNWDAVVRHVDETTPDLVVHVGDLTLDGAHDPADLRHARRQLDRLPVAWHAVPGNHDIGDNPRPGGPEGSTVDADRHRRWLEVLGPDHWSLRLHGWTVVAINAQLLGSGLAAEADQWTWLESQLGVGGDGQAIMVVTHKPLVAADAEVAAAPPYRFVPRPAWDRLRDLFAGHPVALVVSGHVHQYRVLDLDGIRHVWAPTTWAVLPDEAQPILGTKRCGVVSLELAGTGRVEPSLVEPGGLAQLTLVDDVPDPYGQRA